MSGRFRAPAWAWLVTALAIVLFCSLATWQVRRGHAKERLAQALADDAAPALALSAQAIAPEGLGVQRASARGRYQADRQLLQDAPSHHAQPGYDVWTPLELADGALVVVDRGWIARDAQPTPPPPGEVTLTGFWRGLPEPALRLDSGGACPAEKHFPLVVVYPRAADLACLLGPRALPGLLLLDPSASGGFVREWTDTGFPPERHYGYAFQWAALAAAALAVFYAVNRKRPP